MNKLDFLSNIKADHILSYLNELTITLPPNQVKLRFAAIRSFFKWTVDKQYLGSNPTDYIRAFREFETLTSDGLTVKDNLTTTISMLKHLRDRAFVALLVQISASNLQSLALLRMNDITMDKGTMKIRLLAANGTEFIASCDEDLAQIVKDYLKEANLGDNPFNLVFRTLKGTSSELSNNQWQKRDIERTICTMLSKQGIDGGTGSVSVRAAQIVHTLRSFVAKVR